MKIAFVIYSLEAAGAERVTALLANFFAARGDSVALVTFAGRDRDFYSLHREVERIEIDFLSTERTVVERMVAKSMRLFLLRRCLRKFRPDVVIGEMTTTNVLVALASLPRRSWLAVGTEHLHPPCAPLPYFWEVMRRITYPRFDLVVSPAQLTADWLGSRLRLDRVSAIPNPVVIDDADTAVLSRVRAPLPDGSRIVLAVGRLVPQKGFDLLLTAFAAASRRESNWCLVILGEGDERNSLQAQARSLGLADHVFLPGVEREIGHWYRTADLFAFSSRYEGFGNTLAEALAHGVPAVSFDCEAGPREILRDGIDGFLVPSGDVTAFADRLATLMGDEPLRQRMAAAARDARSRFSLDTIGNSWRALITRGLDERGQRRARGSGPL